MANQLRGLFLREFTKQLILNSRKPRTNLISFHPVKPQEERETIQSTEKLIIPRTREIHVEPIHQEIIRNIKFMPPARQEMIKREIPKIAPIPIVSEIVSPSPMPTPEGFSLGKIDILIRDNRVTTIECQGPGKVVLVKIIGKVNSTQIILTEEEIKKIINTFSAAAKIPILGGVFKAAVGNLVITSVMSDFVGSRFIINKYTPYSLLEQNPQFPPELR